MTTATFPRRAPVLPNLRALVATAAIGVASASLLLARALPDAITPEALVARVVAETCEAFRTGDEAALDRLLDERYTLVGSNGEITGKAEQLANARALQQPGTVRVRDVEARVDGDSAIAVGVLVLRARDGTWRSLRFTETLVARDGAWRVTATHVSAMR